MAIANRDEKDRKKTFQTTENLNKDNMIKGSEQLQDLFEFRINRQSHESSNLPKIVHITGSVNYM